MKTAFRSPNRRKTSARKSYPCRTRRLETWMSRYPQGLTFHKDSRVAHYLNADWGLGKYKAVFSATRSASNPSTYFNSDGNMQLLNTSNVPRFIGGYYDATGFHAAKGLLLEGASTNLLINGAFDSNNVWSVASGDAELKYNSTARYRLYVNAGAGAATVNSIFSDSLYNKSAKISISNGGAIIGDVQFYNTNSFSITSGSKYTVSFFIKTNSSKTITVRVIKNTTPFTNYGLDSTITTVANTWIRINKTFTANTTASDARLTIYLGNIGAFDINIESIQVEELPYPSSFIPTTTAALTRNQEYLSFYTVNNFGTNRNRGSIGILYKPIMLPSEQPPFEFLVYGPRFSIDSNNRWQILYSSNALSKPYLNTKSTTENNAVPGSSVSWTRYDSHFTIGTFSTLADASGKKLNFFIDGVNRAQDVAYTAPVGTMPEQFQIQLSGKQSMILEAIQLYNQRLSQSQIKHLYSLLS